MIEILKIEPPWLLDFLNIWKIRGCMEKISYLVLRIICLLDIFSWFRSILIQNFPSHLDRPKVSSLPLLLHYRAFFNPSYSVWCFWVGFGISSLSLVLSWSQSPSWVQNWPNLMIRLFASGLTIVDKKGA